MKLASSGPNSRKITMTRIGPSNDACPNAVVHNCACTTTDNPTSNARVATNRVA